jgi:hypothetical protein
MLNFDKHQHIQAASTAKATSKYRLQLIMLFAALGITFYSAQWAANPQHWEWLVKLEQNRQPASKSNVLTNIANDSNSENNRAKLLTLNVNNLLKDAESIEVTKKKYLDIDDNSTGLLRRELPAYYQMLNSARVLTDSDWEPPQVTSGSFTQLLQSPSAFRGQKFKLHGDALLITKIKETANEFGFDETFEIWLQTRDSGKDLYRIRSSSLPAGLKMGSQRSHMEIYGLFFKRQNYASKQGNRTSPMFVTARVELPKSVTAPIQKFKLEFFLAGTCFLLLMTGLVTWHYMADRRFEREVIHKMKELSPEEKQALDDFSLPPDEPFEIDIGQPNKV